MRTLALFIQRIFLSRTFRRIFHHFPQNLTKKIRSSTSRGDGATIESVCYFEISLVENAPTGAFVRVKSNERMIIRMSLQLYNERNRKDSDQVESSIIVTWLCTWLVDMSKDSPRPPNEQMQMRCDMQAEGNCTCTNSLHRLKSIN